MIRRRSFIFLLAGLTGSPAARAEASTPYWPSLSTSRDGRHTLTLNVPPGFAIFADRIDVAVIKGSGAAKLRGRADIERLYDRDLGRWVEKLRGRQTLELVLERAGPIAIRVTLLGCSDAGFCFAPATFDFDIPGG